VRLTNLRRKTSHYCEILRIRDRSVGIATAYGLDGSGSTPGRARLFSYPQYLDQLWAPPSLVSIGISVSPSPGVQRQGNRADHLAPSSAKVKNGGVIHLLSRMFSWNRA
jgi:hypothetical protein